MYQGTLHRGIYWLRLEGQHTISDYNLKHILSKPLLSLLDHNLFGKLVYVFDHPKSVTSMLKKFSSHIEITSVEINQTNGDVTIS